MAERYQLVQVFEDTEDMFPELEAEIRASQDGTIVYREGDTPALPAVKPFDHTQVLVSRRRSLEAAARYQGQKTAVHNFASATSPGGGVTNGSRAQEESLCRCSTLYPVLSDPELWPLYYGYHRLLRNARYTDRTIYSPGILVIKSDEDIPQRLPPEKRFFVDILTCAAPNLRQPRDPRYTGLKLTPEELRELHLSRARHMLSCAAAQGDEVLILGAFGCGAFRNDPNVVARVYRDVLQELDGYFRTVEFAVFTSHMDTENYDAFAKVLG